ncbi:TadE/TadG family type IV pilus assembly protein [Chenggangzhangella methanolivorans]|uniref:Pilus assembly protein n=1 Tax=Chenggangzhangella methanolivorans TaxID=1437009 RepID=A0A9E6RER9_9HYPH|nr:pilus assembly protein [Chenggangzhangella methanolivorans]QZN99870.1 pilus assembly protein [Chenggangzhangella methanolivorans]
MAPLALLRAKLARFRRSETGLAALETALFAPVLGLLLLGGYDVARFVSIRSNVDKVGFSVADVTSQYRELTSAAMRQVFMVTGSSMPNYTSGTNGVTILTSVYLDNKTPKVKWQCYSTTGTAWTSKIGVEGNTAAVNTALLADANDNLMVSEVYYRFTPVLSTFFKNGFMIYTSSIYRPRLGTLTTKPC